VESRGVVENWLRALGFLEARCFAAKFAKIKEAGAANLGRADLLDLVHDFGVEGEDALNAVSEAHFADRKAALRTIFARDYDTFKRLKALFIAFLDLYLNADRVARAKGGKVGPVQFFGKPLHYWMNRHNSFLELIQNF
jgi:hypothetical protein